MTNLFSFVENGEIKQKFIRRGIVFKGKKLGYLSDDATYEQYNLFPQIYTTKPSYDDFYQSITDEWIWDDTNKQVIQQWNIINKDINDIVIELKNEIATKRYEKEISGVSYGPYLMASDRQSQSMMVGTKIKILENNNISIKWKVYDDWIVIDSTNINEISNLFFDHVENCFSKEEQFHEQIMNIVNSNDSFDTKIANLKNIDVKF